MFELDKEISGKIDELVNKYEAKLKNADRLCIYEEYEDALKLYQEIIDDDYKNEDAYIGILRVHSRNFTIFDTKDVIDDERVIVNLFPKINNKKFQVYLEKKKEYKEDLLRKKQEKEEEEARIKREKELEKARLIALEKENKERLESEKRQEEERREQMIKNAVSLDHDERLTLYSSVVKNLPYTRNGSEEDNFNIKLAKEICYSFPVPYRNSSAEYNKISSELFSKLSDNHMAKIYAESGAALGDGSCYSMLAGFSFDPIEKYKYYVKAIECGNLLAYTGLGRLYENGIKIEKNYGKALECYRIAMENGGNAAMDYYRSLSIRLGLYDNVVYVGNLLEAGRGLQQDIKEARFCYQIAADKNCRSGITALSNLEARYGKG